MKTKKQFIYLLLDENGDPFYVGKTTNIHKRLNKHVAHVRSGSTLYVHNKFRKVLQLTNGFKDQQARAQRIKAIDSTSAKKIDDLETFYIAKYRKLGYKLTNLTSGGEGGKGMSPEMHKAAALKRVGQKRTPEQRLKISLARKGIKFSTQHKANLKRARNKRPKYSKAQCLKMSQSSTGRINIKRFTLQHEDGTTIVIQGLNQFCRENGLTSSTMQTATKQKPHHGWYIRGRSKTTHTTAKATLNKT